MPSEQSSEFQDGTTLRSLNPEEVNERLIGRRPEYILDWAWQTFAPKIVASSSFQTASVPLLHMIAQVCPKLTVVFIDTGYHFPETLVLRDLLVERLGLRVSVARRDGAEGLEATEQSALYRRDPDLCCHVNKVVPMLRRLRGVDAWVSGLLRDQTARRRRLNIVEKQNEDLLTIHPLVAWSRGDVHDYIRRHDLPVHPLWRRGYTSIGCAPCTCPVESAEDERAGRWPGSNKIECGLHEERDKETGD